MTKTWKNPEPPEELLRIFDAEDHEVEPRTRQWLWEHPDHGLRHAVGTIWVVNAKGEILCSKRAETLQGSPGKWQTQFGGKVPVGATFRDTAIRELEEEAGIVPNESALVLIEESVRAARFAYPFDGDIAALRFNDGEITEVRWLSIDAYRAEERAYPDQWCNPMKPEAEAKIRSWIAVRR